MTSSIKQLILDNQRKYYSCHDEQWRHQRNKVRDTIYDRNKYFYRGKVQHLRSSDPRKWWNIINKISGRSGGTTSLSYDDEAGNVISGANLAARLNKFYISVTSDLSPLDTSTLPAFLPAQYELPLIRPWEVCNKLLCLSPFKAIVTAFSAAGARPSNSTPLYRNGRSLTLVSHKEQNSGRSFS